MAEIIENSRLTDDESYGFQSLIETSNLIDDKCMWCAGTTLMWNDTPCVCLEYEELIHGRFDM